MNTEKLRRAWLFVRGAKRVIRSRFFDHHPFFISHLITARCFAKCPTCLWRGDSPEEKDTAKIIDFYRQAKRLGFISTTFWGGEPLLREDIFDILRGCQNCGLITGLITNGHFLPQYAHLLARYLDFLIVSLDIPNEAHDRLRGVEGMFGNIVTGIQQVKDKNPRLKVFINSVISQLNYSYVDQLVQFAEDLSTSITFEAVNQGWVEFPRREGKTVVALRLPPAKEKEIFSLLHQLKQAHSSINNSKSYLRLFQKGNVSYRCHGPKICIRVEPDGSVTNCLDRTRPIGNVYGENLYSILESSKMKRLQKEAEACSSCVDSGAIESSLFWDFHLEVMVNTLRFFMK